MRLRSAGRLALPAACTLISGSNGDRNSRMSHAAPSKPQFTFGIIADIQYCDCDDATNFAGTETRAYRDSLRQTRLAVDSWNDHK
eukprot:6395248-Prymnesium_polylepis.1